MTFDEAAYELESHGYSLVTDRINYIFKATGEITQILYYVILRYGTSFEYKTNRWSKIEDIVRELHTNQTNWKREGF